MNGLGSYNTNSNWTGIAANTTTEEHYNQSNSFNPEVGAAAEAPLPPHNASTFFGVEHNRMPDRHVPSDRHRDSHRPRHGRRNRNSRTRHDFGRHRGSGNSRDHDNRRDYDHRRDSNRHRGEDGRSSDERDRNNDRHGGHTGHRTGDRRQSFGQYLEVGNNSQDQAWPPRPADMARTPSSTSITTTMTTIYQSTENGSYSSGFSSTVTFTFSQQYNTAGGGGGSSDVSGDYPPPVDDFPPIHDGADFANPPPDEDDDGAATNNDTAGVGSEFAAAHSVPSPSASLRSGGTSLGFSESSTEEQLLLAQGQPRRPLAAHHAYNRSAADAATDPAHFGIHVQKANQVRQEAGGAEAHPTGDVRADVGQTLSGTNRLLQDAAVAGAPPAADGVLGWVQSAGLNLQAAPAEDMR